MCSWDLETIKITTPNQRSIFGMISPVMLVRSIRFVDNYHLWTRINNFRPYKGFKKWGVPQNHSLKHSSRWGPHVAPAIFPAPTAPLEGLEAHSLKHKHCVWKVGFPLSLYQTWLAGKNILNGFTLAKSYIYLSIYLSIYPSIYLWIYLCIYLSIYLYRI